MIQETHKMITIISVKSIFGSYPDITLGILTNRMLSHAKDEVPAEPVKAAAAVKSAPVQNRPNQNQGKKKKKKK